MELFNRNDKNITLSEPFKLSDGAVVGTLLAVVGLLIIAFGIGTWQCIRKNKTLRLRRATFHRIHTSQHSPMSTMSSREHFRHLLDVYHKSGTPMDQSGRVQAHGGSKAKSVSPTMPEKQHRVLERLDDDSKAAKPVAVKQQRVSRMLYLSPVSSSFSTPERFRQGSGSNSSGHPQFPVSIISANLLDHSSPHLSSYDDSSYQSSYGASPFVRSHSRNRSGRALKSPPHIGGRADLRTHLTMERHSPGREAVMVSPLKPLYNSKHEAPMFYFAWPEEEEESSWSGWSPLLLKASMSVDTFEDALSVGDEKLLLQTQQVRSCLRELRGESREAEDPTGTSKTLSTPYLDHSYTSTPGSTKGVVQSKADLLPYGLKNTWV